MKLNFKDFLIEISLTKYKTYRYYLILMFIKKNYPFIKDNLILLESHVKENIKAKPFEYVVAATLLGIIIGRIL